MISASMIKKVMTMNNLDWLKQPIQPLHAQAAMQAAAHQDQLTKPAGSLGMLETLVIQLAALSGQSKPCVERVQVSVFAADHGIAARGVSAFPQAVTAQMIGNFAGGGAAVSVLAKNRGTAFEVVNLGTVAAVPVQTGVLDCTIAAGTADFSCQPAMTTEQLAAALAVGRARVEQAQQNGCDLFIGGEMGIGNTSSATLLAAALTGLPVAQLVGPGTGLDTAGVAAKAALLEQAWRLHADALGDPVKLLARVGGFEIAALCGAYLRCAQLGIPVLVDGFICSAAALVCCAINPEARRWLLFAHCSAEPGHRQILAQLEAQPLLDLSMRLGEGSGAVLALDLLRSACLLHAQMATFADAGVANKD